MDENIARQIRELYAEGFRTTAISETLNISTSNVSNVLHKGYWG